METKIETTKLEIVCGEERKVVGTISLAAGAKVLLNSREVTSRFEPASTEYELRGTRAPLRDGELWRCPRCMRPLSVTGLLGKGEVTATIVLGALTAKG
jgi:hypothetical protein